MADTVLQYANVKGAKIPLGVKAQHVVFDNGATAEDNLTAQNQVNVDFGNRLTTCERYLAEVSQSMDSQNSYNTYLTKLFAVLKRGKVYTTKFPRYAVSKSPTGIKCDDNEGMVIVPSTNVSKNRNDYDDEPMFHPYECNWKLDDKGNIIITSLQGFDSKFARDGSNGQVGIVNMPWYVKTWTDDNYWYISVTDTALDGYKLLGECIMPDGSEQGFMVHSKYAMGAYKIGDEYYPYSASGLKPQSGENIAKNTTVRPSYSSLISYCHKLGSSYCAETSNDLFFIQLQFMIKYATINSQSAMRGCTDYYITYPIVSGQTNTAGVVLATSNANNLLIGSRVSVGSDNVDSYNAAMHDHAWSAKVISKTPLADDSTKTLVTLDCDPMDTDTSMFVRTMPWWTGACDGVRGTDGSPIDVLSGKEPFVIGGIECALGGYEVLGNVVMDIQTGENAVVYRDVYICHDASKLTTDMSIVRTWDKSPYIITGNTESWRYISEEGIDIDNGLMVPTAYEATSNTGFSDGLYTDKGTSGQREWWAFGNLHNGSDAGAWILRGRFDLGHADWGILSRLSPNGMYGNRKASS